MLEYVYSACTTTRILTVSDDDDDDDGDCASSSKPVETNEWSAALLHDIKIVIS